MIAVTDRQSCTEDFYKRIQKIYKGGADKIILREKDLTDDEYAELALNCLRICGNRLFVNSRINIAKTLGIKNIHMPFRLFKGRQGFLQAGVSVHSAAEAVKASQLGADYVIAGHIFATDCKKGLPPRGVEFLKEVVNSVDIPVYAIGGITPQNADDLKQSGCAGVCVMSSIMQCQNPGDLIAFFKKNSL